jgi:AP2-like factor (euAP2 lineage)
MKELYLENSKQKALVDDEDYNRVSMYFWYVTKAEHNTSTIRRRIGTRHITLAREVMQNFTVMFDHKDNNFLNNQKNNLRQCSYQQNAANIPKRKGRDGVTTTSKYKGVCWNKINKKWKVSITFNQKKIHLGMFKYEDEQQAAEAYNKKALELFGEFALLNKLEN